MKREQEPRVPRGQPRINPSTNCIHYKNYRRRTLYEEEEKEHAEREQEFRVKFKKMEEEHKKELKMLELDHLTRLLDIMEERKEEFDPSFWGVKEKIRKFSI